MTRVEAEKLHELINKRSKAEEEVTRLLTNFQAERDRGIRALDAARVELEMFIVEVVKRDAGA